MHFDSRVPVCSVKCLTRVPSAFQAAPRPEAAGPLPDAELRAALDVLHCYDLHSIVEEWFIEVLQTDLQANIAPEFWNCIGQYENTAEEPQCAALLLDAFSLLKCRLEPYLNSLELLEQWTKAGLLRDRRSDAAGEGLHHVQSYPLLLHDQILPGDDPAVLQPHVQDIHAAVEERRRWNQRV